MSYPDYSEASLRFFGDDLVPDEISKAIEADPTGSEHKGDVIVGKVTRTKRVKKTGGWRLSAPTREDGDLDAQIADLFASLSDDLTVWKDLSSRFDVDVFCGVFMSTGNDGVALQPATLLMLGVRGIALNLDIYDASEH